MKREVIFFVEFVSLIILIIGYKLLVYVLKINNLALMNFPYFIFTGIFIILSFLILIQIVIIIYTSVKSKILKGTIIITSIIGSIIFFLYSLLILAFMYNPEHIIEKENKKMVACVNSFLQVRVAYYDYVNCFVRGNQVRISEDYGSGGYDPFEIDKMPSPQKYIYYDENGNIIKSNW